MRKALCLALVAGLLVSCTQKSTTSFHFSPDLTGIFSTRPQTTTHAMFLIKLGQKPLLATTIVEAGKKKIDPQLAAAITAEQDKVLKDLQALSPEIKLIYRYRLVLNGLAIAAPVELQNKIRGLANVIYVESAANFSRPIEITADENEALPSNILERNSVKFIGAEEAHARNIRGQNLRVGVIDTGIDYTHAMFGGAGTEEAYKSVDPKSDNPGFPNSKVVGGVDLVGSEYDAASADFMKRIPVIDSNPLDEGGHGTHVAGTVAGIGDGKNTYTGVAPDASLYAIKVFGRKGSTSDAIVIAALEYSADPNSDFDLSDRLDIVNLSLGSGYGEGHHLYNEAIENLTKGGTSVVCSAGNSGDEAYIVGSPGVSDAAFSIAASVDDMDQNWKFRAVQFSLFNQPELLVEAVEASVSKPIAEAGDVGGSLVYAGLADKEFGEDLKARLKGQVAFIDRGGVPFAEKIRRAAEAGSVGVVVANNQPGDPIQMGGEGKFDIPAIMVSQEIGDKLKAGLAKADVTLRFQTDLKIEKPELVDTIAGFSSKGPRSMDALVKPEVAAPGSKVISAAMGKGQKGAALSGTSMAAPHMAGVMALLKQVHPQLEPAELKALVMATAKTIATPDKKKYPVSRQGAGRVQVLKAIEGSLIALPSAISLGEMTVETHKTVQKSVELKNISQAAVTANLVLDAHPALRMVGPATVSLQPGEKTVLNVKLSIDLTGLPEASLELDGFMKFMAGESEIARIPVLAIANKVSQVKADRLVIRSTSSVDSQGAVVDLTLSNRGANGGDAYPFNLIGRDGRKKDATIDPFRSKACDLAESGYRVINKGGKAVLQVAAKLYEPMTTWDNCEISVLIDADGDGVADQELVGAKQDHLKGLTDKSFASILLDAPVASAIRRQFEIDTRAKKENIVEDYTPAVRSLSLMFAPRHSTIAIVEAPVESLKLKTTGVLKVRIAASYQEMTAIEPDDFLTQRWVSLNVALGGAGFADLPEKVSVAAGKSETVSFTKGAGAEKLWIVYPSNKTVVGGLNRDLQSEVVTPVFASGDPLVAGH